MLTLVEGKDRVVCESDCMSTKRLKTTREGRDRQGSTTVSLVLGDGRMEKVASIRSGYYNTRSRVSKTQAFATHLARRHPTTHLFADFGREKASKTRPGSTSERLHDLEALEKVACLGLAPQHVDWRSRVLGLACVGIERQQRFAYGSGQRALLPRCRIPGEKG